MLNKQEFFSEIGLLLKYHTELNYDDIGVYLDILDQNTELLELLTHSFNSNTLKYIKPKDDGWNATNGSVVINGYRVELCCYGDFAINIYDREELLEMLTFKPEINTFTRIEEITQEIRNLKEERGNLLSEIRQMA